MKSVCGSGSWPHFSTLAPSPEPNRPPGAKAYMPCSAWQQYRPGPGSVTPMQASRAIRLGLVLIRSRRRHGDGERAGEQPDGGADQPEQAEEDGDQDHRGAHVAAEHDQAEQQDGARDQRHQQVLPLVEQPLVLLAGQQVGAPEHQRELAELGGLELEGAAEGDPVLVAVDRDPYPRHLDQAHQEDRTREQRVGERAVQLDGHARGQQQQRAAEHGGEQLLAEEVGRRAANWSALIWEAE